MRAERLWMPYLKLQMGRMRLRNEAVESIVKSTVTLEVKDLNVSNRLLEL